MKKAFPIIGIVVLFVWRDTGGNGVEAGEGRELWRWSSLAVVDFGQHGALPWDSVATPHRVFFCRCSVSFHRP